MKKHNPNSLITLIRQYYTFYYQERPVSEKTKTNHLIRLNQILDYLVSIKNPQIDIRDVNISFIQGYREWAKDAYQQTNTSRNIELIKNVINYSISKEILGTNFITQIKTPRSPVKDVVQVTDEELDLIYNFRGKEMLEKAAINYSFQSETGLSYGDRYTFKIGVREGVECIYGSRKKSLYGRSKEYCVPISPRAKEIIIKTKGKLPMITNLDYNESIQKLARLLKIKKHLTTHTARKTFATRMYNKGYSREAIADMMGINIVTLKYYIKESHLRVIHEYRKLTA